jgi:hypothetical protein
MFAPFHSSVGSWSFDHQATLDLTSGSGGSNTWPNPGGSAGDLAVGFVYNSNTSTLGTNGTPAGMQYSVDANGNGFAYDLNSQPTQPAVWGDYTQLFGSVITLKETAVESGAFAVTIPTLTTSLNGAAQHTESGSLAIPLPKPTVSLIGTVTLSGEVGPLALKLPTLQTNLTATVPILLAGTYVWSGTTWEPYRLGTDGIGPAAVAATNVNFTASGIAGIDVFISPSTPYDWVSAPISGTTTTFVIAMPTSPLALSVGDTFTNSAGRGGPFTVTNISPTVSGQATISFTPTASSAFTSSDALTGGTPTNLWFNSGAGYQLSVWGDGVWDLAQLGGAAIANGAITATQIAANTITGSLIQAGTITATEIAANTIAASNLVSGIVVAGIVDSTTINTATLTSAAINGGVLTGARFIAYGTSGEILIYSSTPALGNLAISLSAAAGTDSLTNPFGAGIEIISTGGSKLQLYDSGTAAVMSGLSGAASEVSPTNLSMAVFNVGLSNENIQMQLRGPSSTYDSDAASVILTSSAADGSSEYGGTLEAGASSAAGWGPGTLGTQLTITHQLLIGGATGGSQVEMSGDIHVGGNILIGTGSFPTAPPSNAGTYTGGSPTGTGNLAAWAASVTTVLNDVIANLVTAGIFT